jgi:hypothetical protein
MTPASPATTTSRAFSPRRVEQIYAKLGVEHRASAAALAVRLGIRERRPGACCGWS